VSAKAKSKKTSEPSTMEELLARSKYQFRSFTRGQEVEAKLLALESNSATFDIGGKSEAILSESFFDEARSFIQKLKVGDTVKATIMDPETREGRITISLRHAALDSAWKKLEEAYEKDKEVTVVVRGVVNKGLTVESGNIIGFIPLSQLGADVSDKPDALIGKPLKVKAIEVDREKRRVVFSERQVSEAEEIEKTRKALEKVKLGEVYQGKVVQTTSFGAFVEIKVTVNKEEIPIEGLVHVSEIAWEKVDRPDSVLKSGDKVQVKVIEKDESDLALSIKQAQPDPWEKAEEKYKPETKTKGKVVRISDFGVFVELEPGIEGLVHLTKIPPTHKLTRGDMIDVYVEDIDKKEKRISLGLILTTKPVGYK